MEKIIVRTTRHGFEADINDLLSKGWSVKTVEIRGVAPTNPHVQASVEWCLVAVLVKED